MPRARKALSHSLVLLLGVGIFFVQGPAFVHHLRDRVADGGDSILNSWILAWNAHALANRHAHLWDAPIFFPVKRTFAFSEVMFGNLWLTLPVQYLTGNPTLAFNVLVLSSFVLGMYCTFLLVKGLTGSFPAGVVAGIIFSFNPYRWSEVCHVQLLPFFWAPLALLLAHRFLQTPRPRYLAGLVATLVAQYYTSINLGTILFVTTAIFCAVQVLTERHAADRWFFVTDCRVRLMLVAGAAAGALALFPLALPYLRVTRDWDFVRSQAENATMSCEIASFLVPDPVFRSYQWLPHWVSGGVRGYCGLGLLPWTLAAIGLAFARRRQDSDVPTRRVMLRFAWTAAVLAVLMLGPCLIFRNRQLRWPMPYFLVYHLVPGAKAMRVPTRFIFPLLLCLSVLGGYAVARLLQAWREWRLSARAALVTLFVAFLCVDYSVTNVPGTLCETRGRFPAVYAYLGASRPDRPVLELPARILGQHKYLHYQTGHWRPLLGGESGGPTPAVIDQARRTDGPPTPACLQFLRVTPAMTLVVHLDGYPAAVAEAWRNADLASYGFRSAGRFGDALVWEREGPAPECAGALRVVRPEVAVTRGIFRDRLELNLVVTPADHRQGWRYLDRGISEVTLARISHKPPPGRCLG